MAIAIQCGFPVWCACAPPPVPGVGGSPAEWLQVMNHRDTLHAALQLQRDASLMSSNLTVLHQYAIALHHMSTQVLHSMFGREFFPSGAVNDAAPMPRVLRASTHMAAMGLWLPRVVPCVVRGRPVGSGSRSIRTASLHRFILELVIYLELCCTYQSLDILLEYNF